MTDVDPGRRAALLTAAADAHRMATIALTPRQDISEEDLDWWKAEPQRSLHRELYLSPSLSSRLNAVGTWLRALAGGD